MIARAAGFRMLVIGRIRCSATIFRDILAALFSPAPSAGDGFFLAQAHPELQNPFLRADLRRRAASRIVTRIDVVAGDRVKSGQPLFGWHNRLFDE